MYNISHIQYAYELSRSKDLHKLHIECNDRQVSNTILETREVLETCRNPPALLHHRHTMIYSNHSIWIENEAGVAYQEYPYDTPTPGRTEYASRPAPPSVSGSALTLVYLGVG